MSGPGYFFPPPAQPDSAWQNPVNMNPSWHPQPFLMPHQQVARFAPPPPMNSLDNFRPIIRAPAFERSFQGQSPSHNHGLNHQMGRMPFINKSRGRGSGSSPRGRRAPGSSIRNQSPRPPPTELSPEIKQEKNINPQSSSRKVLESDDEIEKWRAERRKNWPTASKVLEKEKMNQSKKENGNVLTNKKFSYKRGSWSNQNSSVGKKTDKVQEDNMKEENIQREKSSEPVNKDETNISNTVKEKNSNSLMSYLQAYLSSDDGDDSDTNVTETSKQKDIGDSLSEGKGVVGTDCIKIMEANGKQAIGTSSASQINRTVNIKQDAINKSSDYSINNHRRTNSVEDVDLEPAKNLTVNSVIKTGSCNDTDIANNNNIEPVCNSQIIQTKSIQLEENFSDNVRNKDQYKEPVSASVTGVRGIIAKNSESQMCERASMRKGKKAINRKRNCHWSEGGSLSKVRAAAKPTLLEMLLVNDIRHERNVILQCIRHTVRNNFFMDTT